MAVIDVHLPKEYGEARNKLFIRLWNSERMVPKLDGIPHKPLLDLVITCHMDMEEEIGFPASCMVTDEMRAAYGVSEEQLFADAVANSQTVNPPIVLTLMEMLGIPPKLYEEEEDILKAATIPSLIYGAAVLAYPGFLEKIAEGRNIIILPSSTNEILFHQDDGVFGSEELKWLVRDVNASVVPDDQILSDNVYYYDAGSKELRFFER